MARLSKEVPIQLKGLRAALGDAGVLNVLRTSKGGWPYITFSSQAQPRVSAQYRKARTKPGGTHVPAGFLVFVPDQNSETGQKARHFGTWEEVFEFCGLEAATVHAQVDNGPHLELEVRSRALMDPATEASYASMVRR